ncbi:universal stress protein [Actinomadura kijaniata]|uniref:universal stress protein n=1 Tax=Actinomadura kijaniata TaxID=46161 RepID=UPI003F1B0164
MSEILVGIDDSDQAATAAAWAADAAARRGTNLRIVNVVTPFLLEASADPRVSEARQWMLEGWQQALRRAADRARQRHPGLKVTAEQVGGTAAGYLVEHGRDAVMTVVGTHGSGRLAGVLLGSVAQAMIHHSHCPVAVIRPH